MSDEVKRTLDQVDPESGKIVGKTGAKIRKRWVPKEWRVEYESIVALSCTGLSNVEIGARYGYTKEHISNILNTPQALALKKIILEKLRDRTTESIQDRVGLLQEKAFSRVERVIENDTLAENSPMAMFKASMELLKGTGMMKPDGSVEINNNTTIQQVNNKTLIVGSDFLDDLNEGIMMSEKAMEINKLVSGETIAPAGSN